MLDIGMKEWAVICDLLLDGKLALLLRKGGIHESGGAGVFELEHPRFVLFPSWMHQKPMMLKPDVRPRVEVRQSEPESLTLRGVAQVTRIWQVRDRAPLDAGGALDGLHPWTKEQIDMRVNYRPENPLYLMAVRAYELQNPRTIQMHSSYAGCKSWVPLVAGDGVEDAGARAVLSDAQFGEIVKKIDAAMR